MRPLIIIIALKESDRTVTSMCGWSGKPASNFPFENLMAIFPALTF
jgi:hypothetical protein